MAVIGGQRLGCLDDVQQVSLYARIDERERPAVAEQGLGLSPDERQAELRQWLGSGLPTQAVTQQWIPERERASRQRRIPVPPESWSRLAANHQDVDEGVDRYADYRRDQDCGWSARWPRAYHD